MGLFLRASGVFSSLILFISGWQVTSINIDLDSIPEQQVHEEALFNHLGTALMGWGCFTGPLLWSLASLMEKEERKEKKIRARFDSLKLMRIAV